MGSNDLILLHRADTSIAQLNNEGRPSVWNEWNFISLSTQTTVPQANCGTDNACGCTTDTNSFATTNGVIFWVLVVLLLLMFTGALSSILTGRFLRKKIKTKAAGTGKHRKRG